MEIIKIKSDSIAHLSYLIIDGDKACVIDPRRQAKIYLDKAHEKGARIEYIFETHRNEDLVTGSRELQRYIQAKVLHGTGLEFEYGTFVNDGDEFVLNDVKLAVLETPGHTPESLSFALYPEKDSEKALAVFTGDALFVDDVGRTDFFPDEKEKYAGLLYDSIHEKILPLGDHVVLYPAHGAGSVCGGGIADREVSTLGHERIHNPMLKLERPEFIKKKVNENHQMPPYFEKMEELNLKGNDAPVLSYKTLDLIGVENLKEDECVIVDIREPESFLGCHIPGSISIPQNMLGAYAGYFIDYSRPVVLVTDGIDQAREAEFSLRLLGFDNIKSMLNGGVGAYETSGKNLQRLKSVDAHQVSTLIKTNEANLIDVRKPDEWEDGVIGSPQKIFLGDVLKRLDEIDKERPKVVYCGSGRRATIAASLLQKEGVKNIKVFMGSMQAYQAIKN